MVTNITSSSNVQTTANLTDDEDKKLQSIIDKSFEEYNAKQSRSELRTVAHILADIEPQTVVEIGTAQGGSLFVWSQYLDSVNQILSIDKDHTAKSKEICRSMADNVEIRCLDNRSQSPDAISEASEFIRPRGIDFLFIDGGSLRHEVLADYNNFSSMVNPGGIIAFHDILTHRDRPESVDVHEVWGEVREDADEFVEITETIDSTEYGYGLMYI